MVVLPFMRKEKPSLKNDLNKLMELVKVVRDKKKK
jgi:hypothetical protein